MNKIEIYNKLTKLLSKNRVLVDEPMRNHISFKVGGPADIIAIPQSIEEIQHTVKFCKNNNIPYFIMGNGSNLIVRDKGMRGVVVKIGDEFKNVIIKGNTVIAQAGVLLSTLSKKIMAESLKGFEFASGIPGTLGGAVTMNAGAYGGEMKNVIKSVKVLDENGEMLDLSLEELNLGYRSSIIQTKGYIVLEITMELEKGDYNEILEITKELTKKRTTKQPLHLPSAGSVFKRPEGYYAGKLIQDSGLKGEKVGGAQVSELHSGFIVNYDNATAKNVLDLISLVQKTVKEKFGVDLQTEVRVIGEE